MLRPSPPWESWMRFPWGDIGWSLHLCVVSDVHPIRVPSWDLSVVLEDLMVAPFEPLESAPERILTVKVTLFWRMEGFTCSVLSELWRSMWTAPAIGGNLPSCWYVLVLAAMGLPHRSTEFLTGWGTLSRWLMRCVVFLHLSAFGRILLGELLPLKLFLVEYS